MNGSLGEYQRMMKSLGPYELRQVASGAGGDPIAQMAAVQEIKSQADMRTQQQAQGQPPKPTVLDSLMQKAYPQPGPNMTSQSIPAGVGAIMQAQQQQPVQRQSGGPVDEGYQGEIPPEVSQLSPADLAAFWRLQDNQSRFGLESGTPYVERDGATTHPNATTLPAVLQDRGSASGAVAASERPQSDVPQYSDEDIIAGRMAPVIPFSALPYDFDIRDQQGESAPAEAAPETAPERNPLTELLAAAQSNRTGGAGVSVPSVSESEIPPVGSLQDTIAMVNGLYPDSSGRQASDNERYDQAEKRAVQAGRMAQANALIEIGMGLADRGRFSDGISGVRALTQGRQNRDESLSRINEQRSESANRYAQEVNQRISQGIGVHDQALARRMQERTFEQSERQMQQSARQFNASLAVDLERLDRQDPAYQIAQLGQAIFIANNGTEVPTYDANGEVTGSRAYTVQDATREALTSLNPGSRSSGGGSSARLSTINSELAIVRDGLRDDPRNEELLARREVLGRELARMNDELFAQQGGTATNVRVPSDGATPTRSAPDGGRLRPQATQRPLTPQQR